MADNHLISKLPSGVFSTGRAIRAGVSKYALARLLEQGVLERLGRGVYRLASRDLTDEDAFRAATLRIGSPSAICLVSALSHYSLTDAIPRQTWIMAPSSKRSRERNLRILRSRNPHWKVGVTKKDGYWITTPERTIVDALFLRRIVGSQLGIEALRRALRKRTVSLSGIVNIAERLGVLHRLQPYIEALA